MYIYIITIVGDLLYFKTKYLDKIFKILKEKSFLPICWPKMRKIEKQSEVLAPTMNERVLARNCRTRKNAFHIFSFSFSYVLISFVTKTKMPSE